jgi:2'-5' RNA ligase
MRTEGDLAGDGKNLVAHVTILRNADRLLRPTPIPSIAWPVQDFALIDSRLGAEARHTVLRRWPLTA